MVRKAGNQSFTACQLTVCCADKSDAQLAGRIVPFRPKPGDRHLSGNTWNRSGCGPSRCRDQGSAPREKKSGGHRWLVASCHRPPPAVRTNPADSWWSVDPKRAFWERDQQNAIDLYVSRHSHIEIQEHCLACRASPSPKRLSAVAAFSTGQSAHSFGSGWTLATWKQRNLSESRLNAVHLRGSYAF